MIRLSQKHLRWGAAGLFATALAAAFWRSPAPAAPAFVPPPTATPSQPATEISLVALPVAGPLAGPSTLAQLPDGRICAAWLAGPEDEASEAAIWLATLGRDGWSAAHPAVTRGSTAAGTFAHLNKLGRPLLFNEGGWLHLWYENLPLNDAAGAAILHSVSTDAGRSWSKPTRLPTSPLGMLGSSLDGPPVMLADGGLGLPLGQRFPGRSSAWLRLSATGQVLDKIRMAPGPSIQPPSIAVLDRQRAVAGRPTAVTNDGGQHWVAGAETAGMPAPLALLRLGSGRLLLAGNPPADKAALHLWLSADQGKTWVLQRTVETAVDGAAEFTWPALLLGRDGRIHLTYTWRQKGIKHAVFSEAWLDGTPP